jgi:hypothetical protein
MQNQLIRHVRVFTKALDELGDILGAFEVRNNNAEELVQRFLNNSHST